MPLAQHGEQPVVLVLCLGTLPEIIDLARIGLDIEELVEFLTEEVHQFPFAGPDHAHEYDFP